MVELPVVLVVGDDHQGVVPDGGVALEGAEHLVHVALAVHGVEVGVLAPRGRHHHPRDLRQRVLRAGLAGGGEVAQDGVEVRVGVVVGGGGPGVEEGVGLPDLAGARLQVLGVGRAGVEGPEAVGDVAAVVADEAALQGAFQAVAAVVAVDPPVDAGLLELLGHRQPVAAVVVLPGVGRLAVRGTGHQVVAVGDGRAVQRAEVHVADGVLARQRVHPRHVVGGVVAHAARALVLHPGVPAALVRAVEVVVVAPGGGGGGRRHDRTVRSPLLEDARAVLEGQRLLVVVPAHAGEPAEVVVEGAVLLHQDHHVPQVRDITVVALGQDVLGRFGGGRPGRPGDGAGGECAERDGGTTQHQPPREPEFGGGCGDRGESASSATSSDSAWADSCAVDSCVVDSCAGDLCAANPCSASACAANSGSMSACSSGGRAASGDSTVVSVIKGLRGERGSVVRTRHGPGRSPGGGRVTRCARENVAA